MRKIKFRAWTGKQLIYQDNQYLASFIRRVVPQIILDHGGEHFSQHESYLPNGGVIDEYLMQFTGLYDCNDKEIYEGDIVHYTEASYDSKPYAVKWGLVSNDYGLRAFGFVLHDVSSFLEVIGNIYEHPELLEQA